MRVFLRSLLARWHRALTPQPDQSSENRYLREALNALVNKTAEQRAYEDARERVGELIEARAMSGVGPWQQASQVQIAEADGVLQRSLGLRETNPLISQGAYGDIELALQNVEWRREINLSWLEFSRWGIQQIILISRLYYIKNPIIQRGINVAAHYVFGRGVEISSADDVANQTLKDLVARNERVLGQAALCDLQRRLYYDGQIFFVLFADTADTGNVTVRTIDATEIQEIICNPDDGDEPWFYKRQWVARSYDKNTGTVNTSTSQERWYPALGYDPDDKPQKLGDKDVAWDSPVIHMKGGTGVSKWHFDTPRVYAALDWAKAAKKFLEACATVKQALAQIAMHISSKGGQQALEGIKQQLQTTVGPNSSLWDANPTPVNASIFASGPGTTVEAFNTNGAGGDPEQVRRFIHMAAMAMDLPEHFFADVTVGAKATATTLDQPTELAFKEKQERWREALVRIATYQLNVSKGAPSGKLRERETKTKGGLVISEARRVLSADRSRLVYEAKPEPKANEVEVTVSFPAIRDIDMPQMVQAWVAAGTLDNKGGQVVGIDERVMVRGLLHLLGVENADDVVDDMYPEGSYDPDRTKEPETAPVPVVVPGAQPPVNGRPPVPATEAARRLAAAASALRGE